MCPACFANFALIAAGATSSSAAGAFALTKFFRQTTNDKGNNKRRNVAEHTKEGDKNDDETQHWDA